LGIPNGVVRSLLGEEFVGIVLEVSFGFRTMMSRLNCSGSVRGISANEMNEEFADWASWAQAHVAEITSDIFQSGHGEAGRRRISATMNDSSEGQHVSQSLWDVNMSGMQHEREPAKA
jgi:hypothetical protein